MYNRLVDTRCYVIVILTQNVTLTLIFKQRGLKSFVLKDCITRNSKLES